MPRRATAWGGRPVTGLPSKRTCPPLGGTWPVMTLKSVVLPAPFGPMTACRVLGVTLSDTPSRADSAPKVRVSAMMASSGGGLKSVSPRAPAGHPQRLPGRRARAG